MMMAVLTVIFLQLLVQDALDSAADSSNGSSGTAAHVTAQVVVNTSHTGQHTLVDPDVTSSSAGTIVSGSPHYITVTGNNKFRLKNTFKSMSPFDCFLYFIYLLFNYFN